MNLIGYLITPGDDDSDEPPNPDDEPPSPSCMDYIMHFLTLFWKIIFAFIPPTGEKYLLKMLGGNFLRIQIFRTFFWDEEISY